MENISIYSPEGVLLHEAPMSRQNRIANQLMSEHYIKIAFNVASSIPFVAGSYIVYNRWHYFLKKDAYPEPISGVAGYKYVLKFYAPQHRMEQRLMKWLASPNKEATFKLTTTLDTFGQLLVDNMNAKIADEAAEFRWTYIPSYRNDTREVYFDGVSCWEGMVRIAEAFGVEYWLTDINKPGMEGVVSVNELQLNFGKLAIGSNWEEIRESEVVTCLPASKRGVDANYGTRYYIYGSTKNIPEDYYESAEGGVTNHISEKRLHLPDGKPYIDVLNGNVVDSLPVGRVIERVIILEDVFPKNTSTITVIEEREEEIIEGRQDKSYTIVATDTGFDGSDDNVLGTLGVTFTSGALSGSSFDVRWNKPFDNRFHITPRVEGSTGSDQIVIPNDYIKPVVGDTFVLTGIKLPESKIVEAEEELLSKGIAKAKEYGADTNVYECKTDPVYCQKNNKNYRLGTRVKLLGGAFGEEGRLSRIQGYEKALYNEYDATYSVGDNAIYSRIAAIAKGYANDSGRVVREESTKWQNKMNVTIQSTAGNAGIANKVNVLIGDDAWMSAREIAKDATLANRIPYLKADAFAFLQPEDFTVEVAYDGSTWETLDNNNADMRGMFAQLNYGTGFSIDGSNNKNWQVGSKIRITLSPKVARNAKVDFVALNIFANGRIFDILTEYYDGSSGKEGWYSVGDQLNISSNGIAFIKYDQYFSFAGYKRGGARFTFTITKNTDYGSRIVGLSGYSNQAAEIIPTSNTAPYTLGTLWYWDYLKNVYFPNDIYEGGTPLKNKYASISEIPTALPNPESLKYTVNGMSYTYNGSSEATIPAIYTPTQIGSQGQLLQSMGGGAPQWTNLSSIKEAIGFAKDLTGVLEATPEEFTFRPSAGDKSIRDESAVIRRIKGNTTVWEQRVHNANFSEGKGWWGYGNGTITIDPTDGSAKLTHNSDNSVSITQGTIRTIPAGHKTLFIVDYKRGVTQSDRSLLYYKRANVSGYDSVAIDNIASDERRVDAFFLTTTDDTHLFLFYPCLNAPTGTVSTIYKTQLFDLTDLFGAGNEPTTLEAFREVYPDDYYPYSEPEIRNMRATAIETVGFNLYNGDYAKLIGGKTYYIGGTDIGTLTFTPNGTTASEVIELGDDRMYTPISSGKLSSTGADICVHFQHSGIKDGECADYVEHMLELPEIAKYFPDGMNGIGKVYDEINAENAVKRFGVVDLGTLDWRIVGTANNVDKRIYSYGLIDVAKGVASHLVNNIMCNKYNAISADQNYLRNKGISLSQTSSGVMMHIYDPNYNSDDKLSDFVASLNGVLLYYELAEPIVTPIIEPIQLAYDVEDFGTEQAISNQSSSPFRADIVYQFNAEGRIRDNARNIAKLETKVNTLDRVASVVSGRFDGGYVKAEGIIDSLENFYLLPSSSSTEKNKRLASEQFVIDNIPTEVATAMQKVQLTSAPSLNSYTANIVYDWEVSVTTLTISTLYAPNSSYDNVWIIRFGCQQGMSLDIVPTVYWKDGVAPSFGTWGICELRFQRSTAASGVYLGEWKIYR